MLLSDVLVNQPACLVCSFLDQDIWLRLRRTSSYVAGSLCDVILQGALVDMLTQTVAHVAALRMPTSDSFHRVEYALQVLLAGKLGAAFVQQTVGELVEIVCSWFARSKMCTVTNVQSENQKVHKQARVLLRATDPKLWLAASQAYPELSLSVCKILLKWPLNYEDRDILVDSIGSVLPARTISAGPSGAAVGSQLALMLSCGSERRITLLEKELLSAEVANALALYRDNNDVVVPAMGYLFNVAQCEELWPLLVQLKLGPLCNRALQRLPGHPLVQEYAQYILDVLQFVEYGQES